MSGATNTGIVRRLIEEIWNQPDADRRDMVIPELVSTDRVESTRRNQVAFHTIFSDFRRTITEIVGDGDVVMARWSAEGVHVGEYRSRVAGVTVPPTGKRVTWTGISIFRVTDGKVSFNAPYWDEATLLAQLGIQLDVVR